MGISPKKTKTAMDVANETLDKFFASKSTYRSAYTKLYNQAIEAIYGMGNEDTLYEGYTYKDRYATGVNAVLYAIKTYHDDNSMPVGDPVKGSELTTDEAKDAITKLAKDHISGAKSFVYRKRKEYTRVQFTDKSDSVKKAYVDIHHLHRTKKDA